MTNIQRQRTLQTATTSLGGAEVLAAARDFFGRRSGIYAAFVEQEGPAYLTLRGQGGEEVVVAVSGNAPTTMVTGSSYMFDQQVALFLSSLPPAAVAAGAEA